MSSIDDETVPAPFDGDTARQQSESSHLEDAFGSLQLDVFGDDTDKGGLAVYVMNWLLTDAPADGSQPRWERQTILREATTVMSGPWSMSDDDLDKLRTAIAWTLSCGDDTRRRQERMLVPQTYSIQARQAMAEIGYHCPKYSPKLTEQLVSSLSRASSGVPFAVRVMAPEELSSADQHLRHFEAQFHTQHVLAAHLGLLAGPPPVVVDGGVAPPAGALPYFPLPPGYNAYSQRQSTAEEVGTHAVRALPADFQSFAMPPPPAELFEQLSAAPLQDGTSSYQSRPRTVISRFGVSTLYPGHTQSQSWTDPGGFTHDIQSWAPNSPSSS